MKLKDYDSLSKSNSQTVRVNSSKIYIPSSNILLYLSVKDTDFINRDLERKVCMRH